MAFDGLMLDGFGGLDHGVGVYRAVWSSGGHDMGRDLALECRVRVSGASI